jgi:hypothetical protein
MVPRRPLLSRIWNSSKRTSAASRSTLYGVSAWLRIAARWVALKSDSQQFLAVFTDSGLASGTPQFIRPTHTNEALRDAARHIYITDEESLARFSSHSIRVGACVAFHATGIS